MLAFPRRDKRDFIPVVFFVDRSLCDVQWGGLPRQSGPYGERQGVPEMGLGKASQTPLPAQKVSCKARSSLSHGQQREHTHDTTNDANTPDTGGCYDLLLSLLLLFFNLFSPASCLLLLFQGIGTRI